MADPLLVEQRFQTLKHVLRLVSGRRTRLLRMAEFLESLEEEGSFLPAYAPELIPQFVSLVSGTDFTATPLYHLDRLRDILARDDLARPSEVALREAVAHLKAERIRLLHWARDRENLPVASAFSGLKRRSAVVPMVEREQFLPHQKPEFAVLQRISLELVPRASATDDEVHFLQHTGPDYNPDRLRSTMSVARSVLTRLFRVEVKERFSVYCSSDRPNPVVGKSLDAGLAALMVTDLLRFSHYREEFALRDDVAVTGIVDPDGGLVAVDEEGLRRKIEASTFSWVRSVVVPAPQESMAREIAGEVAPEGCTAVQIYGAKTLDDIFVNRRLTVSRHIPLPIQTGRTIWRLRTTLLLLVMAVLLLTIAKMWYGPADKKVESIRFEADLLQFQNKAGDILEEVSIGQSVRELHNPPGEGHLVLYACADVDGDGRKEAVWFQPLSTEAVDAWAVSCRAVNEDTLRWSVPLTRKLDFPEKAAKGVGFAGRYLLIGDFDRDGRTEVLVIAYHHFFPSFLLRLDAATGKELGIYIHTGHMICMVAADLDGDGIKEILVTGINNAFAQAFLAVLDPRFIDGHSPLRPAYRLRGVKAGSERVYALIPRTVVSLAVPEEVYNRGTRIDIYEASRMFRVIVEDQVANRDYHSTIHGLFGFDLHAQDFDTGDEFDRSAIKLLEEERLSEFPGNSYFEEFKKTLLYWDGTDWQDRPIVNRRYLAALARAGLALPPKLMEIEDH